MKMLIIVGYIDLRYRIGCTPGFWQLYKALYQLGHEIIIVPYAGREVETLWWSASSNPTYWEFLFFRKLKMRLGNQERHSRFNWTELIAKQTVQRKWKRKIGKLLLKERDIELVALFNIPLTHVPSLGKYLADFGLKKVFYDGDMPVHLPGFGGFSTGTNMFYEGCFEDYDVVITNSEGVDNYLKHLGARRTATLHWGADPEVFCPVDVPKQFDVFFYGFGTQFREFWIDTMVTKPSKLMSNRRFIIGGRDFVRKGREKVIGDVPFARWHRLTSASRINLNVSRSSHAKVRATSASRPFELAAMKCCIVSNPHNGLEKWFEDKKEIIVVKNAEEMPEIYDWLLSDEEEMERMGERAQARLLREHTYMDRAEEFIRYIT
ncbi:MAG: glycosyltransferase [Candidatus Heimdallarchaeota archaeon]